MFVFCLSFAFSSFAQNIDESGLEVPADRAMGMQFNRVENIDNTVNVDEVPVMAPKTSLGVLPSQVSAEERKRRAEEKYREEAYEAAVNGMFPLKPDEIERFLEVYNDTRQVGETAGLVEPEAEVRVATVSLDPSVKPEVIKLSPGYVTSLTVLDVSGQPWPVQDVSWAGKFEVTTPEEGGHVIRITPMTAYGVGNMSLRLVGLATPVTFSLSTGEDIVHYRFDARIPEYGPNATMPLIADGSIDIAAGSSTLTKILDGAPPSGAERLSVSGVDGRTTAWRVNGETYVRTPFSLLSPRWGSSANSADGMRVYSIGHAPVLLLSDSGNMIRAFIGKEEIVDDGR